MKQDMLLKLLLINCIVNQNIIFHSIHIQQLIMKNIRENFIKMKPNQISSMPTLTFSFSNKEDLRSIITDYVLHHIEQQGKCIPSRRYKSKYVKYPNITLKVNINKQQREISFQFVTFLSKYVQLEKKNIYRQDRIQPLVVDILNFFDELQEKTKGIIFQIDCSNCQNKIEEEVLNLIIEKHQRDKQKKCYTVQIDEYKKKVIAKHTRVSYVDIQDNLKKKEKQFLLQISQIDSFDIKKETKIQKNILLSNQKSDLSDRLKSLIESGEIFENPDKISELKKQKLIEFYQSSEVQYLSHRASIAQQIGQLQNKCFSAQCGNILRDWVIDIGVSQKYYQQKYGRGQKKMINVQLRQKILSEQQI